MGKKRRLRSAQAKFGIKHSAHPRLALLNSQTETVANVVPPAPVAKIEAKVELAPKVVLAPPAPPAQEVVMTARAPEVTIKAPVVKSETKVKTTTTKKRPTTTRTTRKKKTKKKTSSEASA